MGDNFDTLEEDYKEICDLMRRKIDGRLASAHGGLYQQGVFYSLVLESKIKRRLCFFLLFCLMVLTWVDYETFTTLLRNLVKINNVVF